MHTPHPTPKPGSSSAHRLGITLSGFSEAHKDSAHGSGPLQGWGRGRMPGWGPFELHSRFLLNRGQLSGQSSGPGLGPPPSGGQAPERIPNCYTFPCDCIARCKVLSQVLPVVLMGRLPLENTLGQGVLRRPPSPLQSFSPQPPGFPSLVGVSTCPTALDRRSELYVTAIGRDRIGRLLDSAGRGLS